MSSQTPPNRPQRRRGAELETALLEAAWTELLEIGYANMTMESVATRAHTSAAVLYRRWTNKDELTIAALKHYRATRPVPIPDTGNLREDLVTALVGMSQARVGFFAITTAAALSGLVAGSGSTPAQVRDRILGEQRTTRVHTIYRHAHERGEIDLDQIPAAVLEMPFDLVRHDLFMNLEAVSTERIITIVDDLFLPLVAHNARRQNASKPAG